MDHQPRSVYETVLGDSIGLLSPGLADYVQRPPHGFEGFGTGTYEVAGSRRRWLRPVLAYLSWRRILFPEYGTAVPFTTTNSPVPGGLDAVRTFQFAGRTRLMEDSMRVVDGRLHDFLGRRRGLECELLLSVAEGRMLMSSRRLWLHVGPLRLRIPRLASISLVEQSVSDGQHVSVVLSSPGLGDWFEYRGTFTYAYRPRQDRTSSG